MIVMMTMMISKISKLDFFYIFYYGGNCIDLLIKIKEKNGISN